MIRKIAKGIGYLILLVVLVAVLFIAVNWTIFRNMTAVSGAKITEVGLFQPAQPVKGCKGVDFPKDRKGLPAATFAAMREYSDQHGGVGLVVLRGGAIVGEDYRLGANAATRASSQSMHKSVVAMMAGVAVADGLIPSIDVPVGEFLTEWKDDPRGKIPLRAFLSMTSGLYNPSMAKFEMDAMNLMLGDVSDAALSAQIARAPGTFNYQNIDYQVAGLVLSRALAAKKRGDYASWLSQKLWCPLGNANASLWLEHDGGEPRYFAFLDASVRDWARVGELIRSGGQWQGKQLVPADHMAAITSASPANPAYGLGIWRGSPWRKERRYSPTSTFSAQHSEPFLADDVVFLDGYGGQRVYIVPSAGLVISRSGETSTAWDDARLVNIALRGLKPENR